ncbi:uncharacterized protein LOC119162123 [Rhipicephalus microplus]|uniref:uncharacterized protein LOC119162123 n=1 Tax=Rhipicephalus microplus TaxID=6941 RepID=UPI003F6C54B0
MTTNCDDGNAYFLPPHGILEPGNADNLPTRWRAPEISTTWGSLTCIHETNLRIDTLEATVRQQAERLVDYENRSRIHNLLVFGLAEKSIESESDLMVSVVDKIFKEKLDVEVKTIERIHRMGKVQPGKVRPVIMRLYDYREKERVMKNCPRLKGSSISISNDYASETVEVRRKLWQSAAAERDSGLKISLNHDKLKINNKLYTWDQNKNERCAIKARGMAGLPLLPARMPHLRQTLPLPLLRQNRSYACLY